MDYTSESHQAGKLLIDTTAHPYFKEGDPVPAVNILLPYKFGAPMPRRDDKDLKR